MSDFETEFLQGQIDCKEGRPQRRDNDAYLRGYAAQYELEQIQSELTKND